MKCALCLLAGLMVDAVTAFEGTYLCQDDLVRLAATPGAAQRTVMRVNQFTARPPASKGTPPAPPVPPVTVPPNRPPRP